MFQSLLPIDGQMLAERSLEGLKAQMGSGGGATQLLFMGALFAIMYFLLIRPQMKQAKQHKAMLAALKKGDAVVTQGGIIGRIANISEKSITLEVGRDTKLRVLTSHIASKAPDGLLDDAAQA